MSYIRWLRGRLGQRKIILAYASVVLRDERGGVLLQRRTDFDVWGLPGGILEPGESILDCARRELLEESGLTAGELRLVGVYSDPAYDTVYPNGDPVQQYTICFQGRLNGGEMRPDGVETSAQQFFEPASLPFDELPVFYVDMLRDALRGGQAAFSAPFSRPQTVDLIPFIRSRIGKAVYIAAGAVTAVRRADGRLLMVQRADDGEWSLPGGYTNLGENVAHTATRETLEETGLGVTPERILGIYSPRTPWVYPNGDPAQVLLTVFLARPQGGQARPDQAEISQVAWMTPDEVLALDAHPEWARLHLAVVEHLEGGVFVI
ncbi:MAG: NUDIX domain-containing protein [Anaerolineales bacterium]|nr:NUDIX domain-containing protein [Anaerolineales bacterium]